MTSGTARWIQAAVGLCAEAMKNLTSCFLLSRFCWELEAVSPGLIWDSDNLSKTFKYSNSADNYSREEEKKESVIGRKK